MARNEKFIAPAFEAGQESGSGRRRGLLKKFAIASIALGAAFNTASCSADSEPSCPMAIEIVTETATPSAAPEVVGSQKEQFNGKVKLTPEEMQHAKEIATDEVIERLGEFEQLVANGEISQEYDVSSGKDLLMFNGNKHHILGHSEEQGVTFQGINFLEFSVTPAFDGTTLRVSQDTLIHADRDGEFVEHDEKSPALKEEEAKLESGVTIEFFTPGDHLSDEDLTPDAIRKVLEDPELQITSIRSDIGGRNEHAWVDDGILRSYDYKYDARGDTIIWHDVDDPRKTLKDILSDYRRGAGK